MPGEELAAENRQVRRPEPTSLRGQSGDDRAEFPGPQGSRAGVEAKTVIFAGNFPKKNDVVADEGGRQEGALVRFDWIPSRSRWCAFGVDGLILEAVEAAGTSGTCR
jgi:hypothetical protein